MQTCPECDQLAHSKSPLCISHKMLDFEEWQMQKVEVVSVPCLIDIRSNYEGWFHLKNVPLMCCLPKFQPDDFDMYHHQRRNISFADRKKSFQSFLAAFVRFWSMCSTLGRRCFLRLRRRKGVFWWTSSTIVPLPFPSPSSSPSAHRHCLQLRR